MRRAEKAKRGYAEQLALLRGLKDSCELKQYSDISKVLENSDGGDSYSDMVWNLALRNLLPKLPSAAEWNGHFRSIQRKQVNALQGMQRRVLNPEKLGLCYRTWSDISRAANSAIGSNITDMQVGAHIQSSMHVCLFDHPPSSCSHSS